MLARARLSRALAPNLLLARRLLPKRRHRSLTEVPTEKLLPFECSILAQELFRSTGERTILKKIVPRAEENTQLTLRLTIRDLGDGCCPNSLTNQRTSLANGAVINCLGKIRFGQEAKELGEVRNGIKPRSHKRCRCNVFKITEAETAGCNREIRL